MMFTLPIRRLSCNILLALLAAVVASAPRAEAPPIRIGMSLSLSGSGGDGQAGASGRLNRTGYELWQALVNQRGGILGRKVELLIRDDQGDPGLTAKIYEDLILKEKVDLLFAPYSSALTLAAAPVIDRHGYPSLVNAAISEEIWSKGYKNIFGMLLPSQRIAVGFLAMLSDANINKVALIAGEDSWSVSAREGVKKWAAQYNIVLTTVISVPKATTDFEAIAIKARQSGAEAVLQLDYLEQALQLRRGLKKAGWSPKAFYNAVGGSHPKYLELLGEEANGTFSTTMWEPRDDLFPESTQFVKDYTARFGVQPTWQAAAVYASGQVLERAIQKAGGTNRDRLRKVLLELDMDTVIGRYTVAPSGIQTKRFPAIFQWQQGRAELTWPSEARTKAPQFGKY